MAGYVLIDSYIDVISRQLAHRSDVAELRDELFDHLLESADRARAAGLDSETAQQATLDRFGDPHSVAAQLAAVPVKGIDMTHTLGRSAGIFALIASVAWIVTIFGGTFGLVNALDQTWSTTEFLLQSIVQAFAVLMTGLTLVALNLRVAGRFDALTGVVTAGAALAFLAAFLFAWIPLGWGTFLAAALAITVGRTRQPASRGIVRALLLVVVPVLLVAGSFVGIQLISNEESQPPLSNVQQLQFDLALFAAEGVICVLLAAALAVLAIRLRKVDGWATEPAAFA